MGDQIIQCVPNFSEGRDAKLIQAIVAPFENTPGCALLDQRAGPDHNRLVVTAAGRPGPVQEAVLKASKQAIAGINLQQHQGGHPRIGAVDVIPFVPLMDADMAQCVEIAHEFGRRFQAETGVPVYFYEEAALRPERRRLEKIRQGQFGGLLQEVSRPERHPDLGEPKLHPTAGATVIGARKFLIAFNVNLNTDNVEIAKEIAKAVRSSSGGLGEVKGMGLLLKERGLAQVSMNIVDYEKNPLYRVVELIRLEAKRWGVTIVETEVYGMAPAAALLDSAAYYLQMNGFVKNQVVELALLQMLQK